MRYIELPKEPDELDFHFEAGDFKDLYELRGPALKFFEVKMAFVTAGYEVLLSEASFHKPPVAVFRLARRKALKIVDYGKLIDHFFDLLQGENIYIQKRDLTVQRTGDRILVAWLWEVPSCDYAFMALDELLALFP